MSISDFFIGGRQLFGFIAPGTVWLGSGLLVLYRRNPLDLLLEARSLEIFGFVAASFVIGTAVETISFYVAVRLSARIHGASVTREKGDTDFFPEDVHKRLLARTRRLLGTRFPSIGTKYLSDREISQFCKRFVLENSDYLRRRALEYESEINLLAMFILPLVIYSILWVTMLYTGNLSHDEPYSFAVPLCALLIAGLFFVRLHPLRREEAEFWLNAFILLQAKGDSVA